MMKHVTDEEIKELYPWADKRQTMIIGIGLEAGIDVSVYAKQEYSLLEMSTIMSEMMKELREQREKEKERKK